MEGFLIIAGLLILVIGLYLLTYVLNKKTPRPEGTPQVDKCNVCHAHSCLIRDTPDRFNCEVRK